MWFGQLLTHFTCDTNTISSYFVQPGATSVKIPIWKMIFQNKVVLPQAKGENGQVDLLKAAPQQVRTPVQSTKEPMTLTSVVTVNDTGWHCTFVQDLIVLIDSQDWAASFPSLVASNVENIVQDQFVDLQNALWKAACLSSLLACHITPIPYTEIKTKIIVRQSLGSRPTPGQELFTLVHRLTWTSCCCLPIKIFQLLPSRNIWRHISLTWNFPHRHARKPVDVMELFHWCCCWTLLRMALPRILVL